MSAPHPRKRQGIEKYLIPTKRSRRSSLSTPSASSTNPPEQHTSNPILPPTAQPVWSGLKTFATTLQISGTEFGPLKSAIKTLVDCVDTFEIVAENRKDYQLLRDALDGLFHDLAGRFGESIPPGMRPSIINLARGLEREISFIQRKRDQHMLSRVSQAEKDVDEVVQCYRRMQGLLERLSLNAHVNIWMLVDEQATRSRLDRLSPSHAAWYSSEESRDIQRDECTPDTRLEVLEQFKVWRDDVTVERIYWLNGMAGTGKTTLAYTLCKQLEEENKLAANFFCSRLLPACRDAKLIIPTIAYQLANFSYPFRYALSQILEQHPDVHTRRISEQFDKLLIVPFRKIQVSFPKNLVIVIEALDECATARGVGEVLDLLFQHIYELPIKFFLTSRPEPHIRQRMCMRNGQRERFELHLHNLDHSIVQADIRTYLQAGLKRVNISASDLDTLVERSGVLFVYAATLVRFIGEFDFSRSSARLRQVLHVVTASKGQEAAIDELYSLILEMAIEDPRLLKQERDEMMLVLRTVVCAKEPMTAHTLSTILELSGDESVNAAVNPLRSVLNVHLGDEGITTLHKSFSDYLFESDRSHRFHCNVKEHNQLIADQCLRVIKINTPFNICHLPSSYLLDEDVPNLPQLIKQYIPGALLYACHYWGAHMHLAKKDMGLFTSLHEFLSRRLLVWIEVLNLTGKLEDSGVDLLLQVTEWIEAFNHKDELESLLDLAIDAYQFARAYMCSPAARSTPHLYVSALRLWPKEQPVSMHYSQRFQHRLSNIPRLKSDDSQAPLLPIYTIAGCVKGSKHMMQLTQERILGAHKGSLHSVIYSPDGSRIFSGGEDRAIRVWDADTGARLGKPLTGHGDATTSMCCSPDGRHIVSGSGDCTIRVWDVKTGEQMGVPLQGHDDAVYSVCYSPDGRYIASGSGDRTIRVWDLYKGAKVVYKLTGHTGAVYSICYFSAGRYIVSGSADRTIRIWDLVEDVRVAHPLTGHSDAVYSVCSSPDDRYIASGSGDGTIRFWDATTSMQVGNPLWHAKIVFSICYSPDGRHIASGSGDGTIRVWDTNTCVQVGQPLTGHTKTAFSICYSPNGRYIVSGSSDETIRVWDINTGQTILMPFETREVHLVNYILDSPSCRSESNHEPVRIWDTNQGELISHNAGDQTENTKQHNLRLTNDSCTYVNSTHRACHKSVPQISNRFPLKDILVISSDKCVTSFSSQTPVSNSPVGSVLSASSLCYTHPDIPHDMFCSWTFDEEEWVVTCNSHRLLWVSPDVQSSIAHQLDSPSIRIEKTILLNLGLIGENWSLCYHGE